jgi:ribonuclease D
LGCKEFQVVVDCLTVDVSNYKEYLEDDSRLQIYANAKFDLTFLYRNNIWPKRIYDVYITEKVM